MSKQPPLPSMPDWRDPEEANSSITALQTTSPADLVSPESNSKLPGTFEQWSLAWAEFGRTRGYTWMKRGTGLIAFSLFTIAGLSLFGVAQWLLPFLPVYGW